MSFSISRSPSPHGLDSVALQGETRFSPIAMTGSAQPEERFPSVSASDPTVATNQRAAGNSVGGSSNGNQLFGEQELDSALQLLVERAQYITGATGTALALPQGDEMVCRASAGASAPAVGARLQVQSGLTGESISRRQLLRCDNAESDPRVNLETCRALGIASIVVLPLLRRNGEVRGLFELFSDHPYAFEERDLIALERMADLTSTALDLAEQRRNDDPAPVAARETGQVLEVPAAAVSLPVEAKVSELEIVEAKPEPVLVGMNVVETARVETEAVEKRAIDSMVVDSKPQVSAVTGVSNGTATSEVALPSSAAVPEAMLRVQKCSFCGFPVSEGRALCLDCEKKDGLAKQRQKDESQIEQQRVKVPESATAEATEPVGVVSPAISSAPVAEGEFVPSFLANAKPVRESWLADHVNLLAVVVLILGILVAVVVFR
jgi:GAF domain-containing protein